MKREEQTWDVRQRGQLPTLLLQFSMGTARWETVSVLCALNMLNERRSAH